MSWRLIGARPPLPLLPYMSGPLPRCRCGATPSQERPANLKPQSLGNRDASAIGLDVDSKSGFREPFQNPNAMPSVALLVTFLSSLTLCASASDWPGWRGPDGLGVSDEKNLPTEW